jgi:GT2 family glycosyltransferase
VAVSIINHQQYRWLAPCLTSLLEHPSTAGPSEIVVLDNASNDGSVQRLRSEFPAVRLLAETRRRGFGANHSLVIDTVDTDLVLLLNPDAVVHEGTIDRLVEAFAADERVCAAGGPILNPDGTVWRGAPFDFPTPMSELSEALVLRRRTPAVAAAGGISVGTGWLSGSALMIDRHVFLGVGGFDPRFYMYFEETDLCRRMVAAGGCIAFQPEAPVTHVGRTAERPSRGRKLTAADMRATTEYERSALAYMHKHHGRLGSLVYRLSLATGGLLRWLVTFTPVRAKLAVKGEDVASTRAHHRRRIGVALKPASGVSFGDAAVDYNRAQRVPSDTLEA